MWFYMSAHVFGVSTESMQLSFDARGNSVPTILLMMQRHLYAQGGMQAEGIFRINAENSQEEHVRDQLNRGIIPDGVDVHSLAGLIKAWFRELPSGVLDSLSPEQVMQSQSEEECAQLVRFLPPTEAALLDWAINLMADVAQMEHLNKMNARKIAMVFAPNMTQMADPLTALMYAVQVMNFLKTLIVKTLKEREESMVESGPVSHPEHSDEDGHQSSTQPFLEEAKEEDKSEEEKVFIAGEPDLESPSHRIRDDSKTECTKQNFLTSIENVTPGGASGVVQTNISKRRTCVSKRTGQSSVSNFKKGSKNINEGLISRAAGPAEKIKGPGIVGRINSRTELVEAWR
nr:rho gtpase-activating protein 1 [Quercus suber]